MISPEGVAFNINNDSDDINEGLILGEGQHHIAETSSDLENQIRVLKEQITLLEMKLSDDTISADQRRAADAQMELATRKLEEFIRTELDNKD